MNKKALVLILLILCGTLSTFGFVEEVVAQSSGTFGNTTVGSSDDTVGADIVVGTEFYLDRRVNASSITVYYRGADAGTIARCAIYNATDNNLVVESENKTGITTKAWYTFNLSSPSILSEDTNYILAIWADGALILKKDDGTTNQTAYETETFSDAFPTPFNPNINYDRTHSIYCNYEEISEYNFYFHGLYNEDTGLLYDVAERAVNVTAYFSDGTAASTFEVNGSDYVMFNSTVEYFNFDLGSVDRQYWLSSNEGDTASASIYIFNSTLTTYTITFHDWTGALATYSWVSALRSINGTDMIVDKRKIDEENKILISLEYPRTYTIQVEAVAGTTYTWGDFIAGSDTSVDLVVRGTEFPQDVILTYRYVRAWANRTYYNSTHDSIYVLYEDTKENTDLANITIYYGNDTSAHSYECNSTNSFTYTWNDAHNETSYYLIVTITHGDYGTLEFRQSFLRRFEDSPFSLDFLGTLPGGISTSTLLPSVLLLIATLAFSALTAGIGGIIVVTLAGIMTAIGWVSFDVNLLAFAAILAVLYAILKNYHRVTVR